MSTRGRPDSSRIHPTAIVDAHAELAPSVEVGPYSIIGAGVRIDEGTLCAQGELLASVVDRAS